MTAATHFDSYAVINIADYEPETFIYAFRNSNLENPFMQTSEEMDEPEMRAFLKELGHTETHIISLIQKARENPR